MSTWEKTELRHVFIEVLIDSDIRDGQLYSVTLMTKDGPVMLSRSDYSGIVVLRKPKPKTAKRWKVFGEVNGLNVVPFYTDCKYTASDKASGGLEKSEVDVYLDENGEVSGEVSK